MSMQQMTRSGQSCNTLFTTAISRSHRLADIPQWSLAHIAHAILIPQELIDSGADIHAVTHQEWTALHAAARYGHTDIVKASFCFT